MQSQQKKILLACVLIVFLLAFVPPWQRNGYPAGYRPIFVPPDGAVHIDLTRLLIPIFAVVVATAVGIYLTRNNRQTVASSQQPAEHDMPPNRAVDAWIEANGPNAPRPQGVAQSEPPAQQVTPKPPQRLTQPSPAPSTTGAPCRPQR